MNGKPFEAYFKLKGRSFVTGMQRLRNERGMIDFLNSRDEDDKLDLYFVEASKGPNQVSPRTKHHSVFWKVREGRELKMYLAESNGEAMKCMVISLFFLGQWPAILVSLEWRGRLPQHSYLDYTIANLLTSILFALTFGQIGDPKPGMPNFITQLSQVLGRNIWIGMAIAVFAGFCLALFPPLFNLAANDQFHYLKKGIPHLALYTALFYFSISAFLVALILNIIFLYLPVMVLGMKFSTLPW